MFLPDIEKWESTWVPIFFDQFFTMSPALELLN